MTDLIPILLIDGRPVRRRRFMDGLQTASDLVVVAAISNLESFDENMKVSRARIAVVDGAFTDTPYYKEFEASAKRQNCVVVPVWDYPTSDAERAREALLAQAQGKDVSTRPDPRLSLLIETLRAAANGSPRPAARAQGVHALKMMQTASSKPTSPIRRRPRFETTYDVIVGIGASTGGVQALSKVLRSWPEDCPPTLIVQHMPHEFVAGFTDRLNRLCPAEVVVAEDGDRLSAGRVFVAPGDDRHMRISQGGLPAIKLTPGPAMSGHIPSVDALFESIAALGPKARCGLLTGMGEDGANGMVAVLKAGGRTVAQDEATCTVFGMPREAIKRGGASDTVPIDKIGPWLLAPGV